MRSQAKAGILLLGFITATIAEAQTAPRQPLHKNTAAKPAAAIAPAPQPVPQSSLSLLDQPAKPASIETGAGKLSIQADNASLPAILHEISTQTGMTVEGSPRDQRIFGTYGPAAPREVLSALLDGLGYNVMMLGSLSTGVPRQLVISSRTGGPANNALRNTAPVQQNVNQNEDQDDSVPDQQDSSPQPPRPEPNSQEPGPIPDQQPPSQPGQVKTPEQMLQELQQLRRQQQPQANPQ